MIIEDGTGTGKTLKVSETNRGQVDAVIQTEEHFSNHHFGRAYNVLFDVTPAGADDVIFYMKNLSDKDIIIEGVWWSAASAEQVYYKLGDAGTTGGTSATISPGNLNAGSGKEANTTILSNTASAAVDITGLAGGTIVQKLWLISAESSIFNTEQDIILPKNQIFTIYCVNGSIVLRGTLAFHFNDNI